jgi:hypothetical protein
MIARLVVAMAIVVGVTATARAQTTADGVAALVRGDDGRAAGILQPIVEDWRHRDAAAAFFLGTLYETGRGVPLDPLRACALYQMAMMDYDGVFAPAASTLVKRSILSHRSPGWNADCTAMANIGLGNRFARATFTFGDQTVEWSIGGATVTVQDRARWFPTGIMTRGAVFLPLRATELHASAAGAAMLYYVQLAWLEPVNAGWTLRWSLYQVVSGELRRAAMEEALAQFNGGGLPDLERLDLGSMVDLRVNDRGLPECTVQTLTGPRSVVLR